MSLTDFQRSVPGERLCEAFGEGLLERLIASRQVEHLPGLMQGIEHLILTSADLEHAFGRQFIRPDKLRLYAGRREVDLELMKVKHNDRIDLQRLAQLFAQGVTAVANRVDRSFPAISDMVNTLTMWLRESIEVVAVMSFGEQSGISAHHDHENVFIVQLEGGKEWTLLGNLSRLDGAAMVPAKRPKPRGS